MRFAYALVFALLGAITAFAAPSGEKLAKRASRTSPPAGAKVVRASGAASGEFSTVQVSNAYAMAEFALN